MPLRFLIAILSWALINIFVAARIIHRWPWAETHATGAYRFVAIFFLLQLMGLFGDRLFLQHLKKKPGGVAIVLVLDWLSYLAFGVMSILIIYEIIIDVVYIACAFLVSEFDPAAFDHYALLTLAIATLGTVAIGLFNVLISPRVEKVTISIKNLPPAFNGFKIVQLSDLHIGSMIRRSYAQKVVNITNGLKPDLIALTGDFVDGSVEDLSDDIAPIAQLQAPSGTFFITGNHEYYSGALEWIAKFQTLGARVLVNEHVQIKRGDAAIVLAGVTDYKAGSIIPSHESDPLKSIVGAPHDLVRILLAHQPGSYLKAEQAGFDLQLSGHTHAGQYFPFTFLVRYFQPFYKNLNRYKNMWVYVNRGTGYWGPPLRTGAPCEITLITLTA